MCSCLPYSIGQSTFLPSWAHIKKSELEERVFNSDSNLLLYIAALFMTVITFGCWDELFTHQDYLNEINYNTAEGSSYYWCKNKAFRALWKLKKCDLLYKSNRKTCITQFLETESFNFPIHHRGQVDQWKTMC